MHVYSGHLERLRFVLAAGVVALLGMGTPALLPAATAPATASGYVPTMADYLGVYDAIQRYRWGLEKRDQKMLEKAFWEDGVDIAVLSPGQEIRIPLKEIGHPPPLAGLPGPNVGPRPAVNAGPPGAGGGTGGGEGEVWHLPLDSYIHFESATRATHYEYYLSIYPQPEKKRAEGNLGNMQDTRTSIVGWPGHYEDILEKRNGEWRILSRKTVTKQK
jgi:hypothetical protein